jgi:stage III sporulation protein SpoIIIAA
MQPQVVDDLGVFLEIFPTRIREILVDHENLKFLIEVILDLGRVPQARFPNDELNLGSEEVSEADLEHVIGRIGEFGGDNRAGIERTLHRISAIRNRKNRILGLTCRVGRAVFGTINVIEDLVLTGKSILLLGRPGVGKTTMLREVARVLGDAGKRVIIVDTSNEIAGDGDIPHPAIGRARRMQVPTPTQQHDVMIQAVENHMPEVIVIDEMGTELEAQTARTIAERGVQLIATAHGNTLENLVLNPTLSDLVGGVQTVILGDIEARRRRTQKTVLERKAPPTFPILVEIQSWERVAVHKNVRETMDSMLRGGPAVPEVRSVDSIGRVTKNSLIQTEPPQVIEQGLFGQTNTLEVRKFEKSKSKSTRILPFGVSKARLEQLVKGNSTTLEVVQDLKDADVLLTTKNHYRRSSSTLKNAETKGIPIYVLRKNTIPQMEQFIRSISSNGTGGDPINEAIQEAQMAVDRVLKGEREVELTPQSSYIRRLQHLLAQRSQIMSRSRGREPNRRVTIIGG